MSNITQYGKYSMTNLLDTYRKTGWMVSYSSKWSWEIMERETKEQRVLKILAKIDGKNTSSGSNSNKSF